MTNFKRRLVSTALAVTMAVTLLPLPANAADTQKDISIGWNAQKPQTTMEQVTVDLAASLSDASGIESADVYIELTDDEFAALDQNSLEANSDVKLATELPKPSTGQTIYILDEPTTGLHTADVHKLIEVLQKLVEVGNTVVVIEHNLDVIKTADHIIDLGPEGGDGGGNIVVTGTPGEVAQCAASYTGQYLKRML